jgi:hypothetical protein
LPPANAVHHQCRFGLWTHCGIVDPLATALFIFAGEHRNRARIAATGPEVDDIGRLPRCRLRRGEQKAGGNQPSAPDHSAPSPGVLFMVSELFQLT